VLFSKIAKVLNLAAAIHTIGFIRKQAGGVVMMGKFRLWGFDYNRAVVTGARHLNVSEYELFEIAYRGWFKQECDPAEIHHTHHLYCTECSLPFWVKHYVRQLDARTHYMTEQRSYKGSFCWSWLSRLVVLLVLPSSYSIIKQRLMGHKFSLYC
jgi:hypothetical protein